MHVNMKQKCAHVSVCWRWCPCLWFKAPSRFLPHHHWFLLPPLLAYALKLTSWRNPNRCLKYPRRSQADEIACLFLKMDCDFQGQQWRCCAFGHKSVTQCHTKFCLKILFPYSNSEVAASVSTENGCIDSNGPPSFSLLSCLILCKTGLNTLT